MSAIVDPTQNGRLLTWFRALVRSEFPRLVYLGTYEYIVQSATATTVSARPADTTLTLPELAGVPIRLPIGTLDANLLPSFGQKCLIMFVNGDPTRPAMVSFDQTPIGPLLRVARQTDPVVAGPFAGTIVTGSTTVRIG